MAHDEIEIVSYEIWRPGRRQDPAKYLVNPGSVPAPGKHKPGSLAHARPYIVNKRTIFVFPVGVEGFRRGGSATLGLHKYIGDNTVDGTPMHREEARIELSGTFPGITAQDTMVECINMLRSIPEEKGLVLYAPGVFEREQYVLAENWDFTHAPDDRSHSIDYTITFVRIGEGTGVKDPAGKPPPPQPGVRTNPRGKAARVFVARDGARTFQQISTKVYGSAARWREVMDKNRRNLGLSAIPTFQMPTHRWPIGTKINY